jgi:hypothetical protein
VRGYDASLRKASAKNVNELTFDVDDFVTVSSLCIVRERGERAVTLVSVNSYPRLLSLLAALE